MGINDGVERGSGRAEAGLARTHPRVRDAFLAQIIPYFDKYKT